ncbi:MAG: hypothetical protein M0009_09335 [Deltaproteobacteria bacterium]|nr:hypothetical protein [Deltaproteobacteria bacterium]
MKKVCGIIMLIVGVGLVSGALADAEAKCPSCGQAEIFCLKPTNGHIEYNNYQSQLQGTFQVNLCSSGSDLTGCSCSFCKKPQEYAAECSARFATKCGGNSCAACPQGIGGGPSGCTDANGTKY